MDSNLIPIDQMLLSFPRVDLCKVAELKSFDRSEKLFHDLIAIFKAEFENNIPIMKRFLKDNELSELSRLAHRLRSTGYNCAASRVSEILKRIEIDSADHEANRNELQILINALEIESLKTLQEIKIL